MKVLITGGAGFIGFHLATNLSNMDSDIVLCDNLFRGKMDNEFKNLIERENVKFINMDLTIPSEFRKLEKDFDHIYHLAAINGTKYFYEIPNIVLRTNILSLINTLDWLRDVDFNKFLFTSSSEVYAGLSNLPIPTPEEIPVCIGDIENPRFSYAGSKIVGEQLCHSYAKAFGFKINIIRPHNVYGQRMGYEHVIPQFIMRIIRREDPFKIYGSHQSRSFCYIEDFLNGLKMAAESSISDETFNMGNDSEEIQIINLVRKMFDFFDFHPDLEILPAPEGSVERRCPDITKAKTMLNYSPIVPLDKGLKMTCEGYSRSEVK